MRVLVIDNYDSFTWNLVHLVEQFTDEITVRRNDKISVEEALEFPAILLSPGPGLPADAGIMPELIRRYAGKGKLLGVCLGMQGIAECFGGDLSNLSKVLHGKKTHCKVTDAGSRLFQNLPETFEVGHYHSWVVNELPDELIPTAYNADGLLMALKHRDFDIEGVQFHPESVMTPLGKEMIGNWLG